MSNSDDSRGCLSFIALVAIVVLGIIGWWPKDWPPYVFWLAVLICVSAL